MRDFEFGGVKSMPQRYSRTIRVMAPEETDDFMRIKGIGPAISACLKRAGIQNFAQIAASSPHEIAAIVTSRSPKRITREKWIEQARELALKRSSAQRRASRTTGETRQRYATFTVELLLDADNSVRRTRVTQVQTEAEAAWPGWQDARLMDFFVQQAGLSVSQPEVAPLLEPASPHQPVTYAQSTTRPPSPETETGLSGMLRVCDLTTLAVGSSVCQSIMHVGETFNVRMVLDLTEVKRSTKVPLSYAVAIWAKKFGMKSRQLVGEGRGTFMPADQVPCTVEAVIDSQGIYRLEALITLTEEGKESLPQHGLMATQTNGPLQVF
jgi:hypothetical protein